MTEPTEPTEATEPQPPVEPALKDAVRELEAHAATLGWDQPARLYALVPTDELVAREPGLAEVLGIPTEPGGGEPELTAVEQDPVPGDRTLEQVLEQIMWPAEVYGVAAVLERLVLPSSVGAVPEDPAAAEEFAAAHPEREEVRIVAGATRAGSTYCALRMRSHDEDFSVLESTDLVPALLELLVSTLEPSQHPED